MQSHKFVWPVHTFALEHVRRMPGGAQAQLLRCADGAYYVVKFQNNPQGVRILANDLLGTLLAQQLDLPVAQPAVVWVSGLLIHNSEEMTVDSRRSNVPCGEGACFGSRYLPRDDPGHGGKTEGTCGYLRDSDIGHLKNLSDFAGMLVFDKWTCNTDGRQVIFDHTEPDGDFRATMIDQGNCFNGSEWNFPDAPLLGHYHRSAAYEGYSSFEVFEPWLDRLENHVDATCIHLAGDRLPQEWYGKDASAFSYLLDKLDHRRKNVRDLLWTLLKASPRSFPNWVTVSGRKKERAADGLWPQRTSQRENARPHGPQP
jgi:hypothetical protein